MRFKREIMLRFCVVFASTITLTSMPCAIGQDVAVNDEAIIDESACKELAAVVEGYLDRDLAVGAELLVLQKGQPLFHESFGFSDRDEEQQWTNDTICNIRSMTKPITSAAAQILIDRKLLELDVPVANYLKRFDNEESKAITVRQVLTHRSGLPLTNLVGPFQYSSLEEQVGAAGEKGPEFEPGSKFWYSDLGTDVVGALVAKVSGEPLHEFVQREIFDPLEMTNTLYGIDASDARLASAASLYLKGNQGWMRFWKPNVRAFYPFAWGSQTVYSTTTDYGKFLGMILNRGKVGDRRLLSEAAIDRMLEPVSRTKLMGSDKNAPTGFRNLETYYGQMLVTYRVIGDKEQAPVVFGHSGSDGTNAWVWPEKDLMILYFTQSRGGMTPLRIEEPIDELLIHRGNPEPVPDRLKPYLGTFVANHSPFDNEEFTVKLKNGKLVLDVPSQLAFVLKDPDDEGLWAFEIADVNVEFDRNEAGEVIGLKLHQKGRVFEVPRKGTARAKELSEKKKDKSDQD